jgi:membrane protease subunit HflC
VKNRLSLVVATLVVLVLLLRMTVYTVQDSEVAVLLTFGKPTSDKSEAGLSFKWPWPIQTVKRFDGRLRVLESPLEEMTTADEHAVLVGAFALWRVSSAKVFLEKFKTQADAERYLQRRLRHHQIAVISGTPFGALVSTNRKALKYTDVEDRIKAGLSANANTHGIAISMVGIRRLSLPKSSTEPVFDRMQADRDKLATTILQEGKERADAIRRNAEEERSRLLVQAEKDARDILIKADRDASPHYKAMAKDPELAIYLKKLEATGKLFEKKATAVLDSSQPPLDVFKPRAEGR